jgi:hypothetical protein
LLLLSVIIIYNNKNKQELYMLPTLELPVSGVTSVPQNPREGAQDIEEGRSAGRIITGNDIRNRIIYSCSAMGIITGVAVIALGLYSLYQSSPPFIEELIR